MMVARVRAVGAVAGGVWLRETVEWRFGFDLRTSNNEYQVLYPQTRSIICNAVAYVRFLRIGGAEEGAGRRNALPGTGATPRSAWGRRIWAVDKAKGKMSAEPSVGWPGLTARILAGFGPQPRCGCCLAVPPAGVD